MQCPSCKNNRLKATKLEDGLPVNGCDKCGGAIISLLHYRDWAERTLHDQDQPNEQDEQIVAEARDAASDTDSRSALVCPKCSKIMTKFNISGCTKNRLDLCTTCDEAWLDAGEWELLKALSLSKDIPSVFTDPWQRKVRKEIGEIKLKDRFTKIVGEADMEKAEEVRTWLKEHDKRTEILFYLGQE